jgi:hypothetical protein
MKSLLPVEEQYFERPLSTFATYRVWSALRVHFLLSGRSD